MGPAHNLRSRDSPLTALRKRSSLTNPGDAEHAARTKHAKRAKQPNPDVDRHAVSEDGVSDGITTELNTSANEDVPYIFPKQILLNLNNVSTANQATTTQNATHRFFQLPHEIRDTIYKLVVGDRRIPFFHPQLEDLNMLGTCPQIYHETCFLSFTSNTFFGNDAHLRYLQSTLFPAQARQDGQFNWHWPSLIPASFTGAQHLNLLVNLDFRHVRYYNRNDTDRCAVARSYFQKFGEVEMERNKPIVYWCNSTSMLPWAWTAEEKSDLATWIKEDILKTWDEDEFQNEEIARRAVGVNKIKTKLGSLEHKQVLSKQATIEHLDVVEKLQKRILAAEQREERIMSTRKRQKQK
ncbi:hypothetical protein EJ08DRAFT_702612 [Tothia fuscella]|uniref:Uncharacterized protein n=1 Tax=Tothia fuscella TaxID=1048955 RepID=A0A9P4NG40_9PEZI|nr:hypothetical protein EJ08DRAFT_702612 [Tothia fuscella]